MTSERDSRREGFQNTQPTLAAASLDSSDITALLAPNRSRGGGRRSALKWLALVAGFAFVLVIMAFPAVMIGLSEDARLQYLSLQKQSELGLTKTANGERSSEPTAGRSRATKPSSTRRTFRMKFPKRPSTAATKEEEDIPIGLHAMQCADESCESETSYMKHLFTSGKDPCTDFYDFVCGHWKEQNALPPNRLRWSVEDALVQKIEGAVYWFLEDFARIYKDVMANTSLPTSKLYSHLKACEDTDSIDLKGFAPLKNVFRHLYLEKWPLQAGDDNSDGKDPDLEEITGMIVRDLAIHPFAYVSVRGDLRRGSDPWIQVDEPRLSMSRHKYFDVNFNLNEYKQQVTDALNLVNERNDSAALAAEIVDLEQQLAEGMDGTSGWLSEYAEFDTVSLDDLPSSEKWSWPAFLSALFDDDSAISKNQTVLVKSSKYLEKLMKILETTPRHALMNYLGYRVMSTVAVFLPKKAHFLAKWDWKRRLGYRELPERWRVCLRAVDGLMGLTMHALHYENYAKRNTLNFKNHLAKFAGVVSAFSSFFNDYAKSMHNSFYECKTRLQKIKLKSFAPNISKALNLDADIFEAIPVVEDGNALEGYYVARSYVSRAMWDNAFNATVDPNKWRKSVFDLTCSYDPAVNSFELPLALFHEPFFYNDDTLPFDDPRVTFRIGRELAKVCPQNGVTYDPDRERAVWMDATLNTTSSEDARCLIRQYSNVTAREINSTLDGMSTLPENVLDNMVLPPLYEAYREAHSSSLKEHTIHHIDGTAFNQVFFLSFALGLCENMDKAALRDMVMEGKQVPARYRVNLSLMNFNKFGKIFGCPPGTPMNPVHKCTIWMKHE